MEESKMETRLPARAIYRIALVFAAAGLLLLVTLSGASAFATRSRGVDDGIVNRYDSTRHATQSTWVVTSTADNGYGTLRWAMQNASNGDTITFDPSVFPCTSPMTIALTSALPAITQGNLTIDASAAGVILDGSGGLPGGADGFHVKSNGNSIKGLRIFNFPEHGIEISDGASNNLIGGSNAIPGGDCPGDRNIISGNHSRGIAIRSLGTNNNIVSGNYIGTDPGGTIAVGNQPVGIQIYNDARENRIGGSTPGEHNLISGNTTGIMLNDPGTISNTVIGNYIGTDASGTLAVGNSSQGVQISNAKWNRIGGSNATPGGVCTGECNVISGNGANGVVLCDDNTVSNTVIGNYIGTNVSGTAAIRNGDTGVLICSNAHGNQIGGSATGEGNLISGNRQYGVMLNNSNTMSNTISGNTIVTNTNNGIFVTGGASWNTIGVSNTIAFNGQHGVEVNGSSTISDTITRNSIYSNVGDGITLTNGGNRGLLAPYITGVDCLYGVVTGTTCANCTVEIFSDANGQGKTYEGGITAGGSGAFIFSKSSALAGPNVTATATDGSPGQGDTSAFSAASRCRPQIIAVSPISGAVGVTITAPIVITFSEPISIPTFTYTVIPNPDGWHQSWNGISTVVTLTHYAFSSGTLYTVTVTAANDLAGNPLSNAPYTWHFTTIDITPPQVTAVSPISGAVGVTITAPIVITFSEPISIPTFAYTIIPNSGGWITSWNGIYTVVTLTHSNAFSSETVYTASIIAADDLAGNPLSNTPYTWHFTTIDITSPQVITVSPISGAVGVTITAPIVITFSEPISIFTYTIIPNPGGWITSWNGTNTVVTLTHNAFSSGTFYTVTVTAANDLAGNPLSNAPYTWHFTTIDITPPQVTAVSPISGAVRVILTAPIVITFSEPIITSTFTYTITPDPGDRIASWNGTNTVVTLTHNNVFSGKTVYTVTVTAADDLAGNPLSAPYTWHFATPHLVYLPIVLRNYTTVPAHQVYLPIVLRNYGPRSGSK
jgi:hypothetical protein